MVGSRQCFYYEQKICAERTLHAKISAKCTKGVELLANFAHTYNIANIL